MMNGTPLSRCAFAAIDFESAGAAPGETDQPVQIGVVRVEGLFGAPRLWDSYLSVSHPVHWAAAKVHGITTEMLAGAPSLLSLWPRVRELLGGAVVVGHHCSTERRFLRCFPGHGLGPWLDTLTLARVTMPGRKDYSLGAVAEALGITSDVRQCVPGRRWHDALFDAVGSLFVLQFLVRALDLREAPLSALGKAVKENDTCQ
ncbi:MAG: 3'-5' exonuclease [Akkermansia sp.]|nr:3'-5' exonuclease [Akkermansia sp.]